MLIRQIYQALCVADKKLQCADDADDDFANQNFEVRTGTSGEQEHRRALDFSNVSRKSQPAALIQRRIILLANLKSGGDVFS